MCIRDRYDVNLNEDSIDAELENLQQLSKDTESHMSLSGIEVNLSNSIPSTSNSNMTFTWAKVQELFKMSCALTASNQASAQLPKMVIHPFKENEILNHHGRFKKWDDTFQRELVTVD